MGSGKRWGEGKGGKRKEGRRKEKGNGERGREEGRKKRKGERTRKVILVIRKDDPSHPNGFHKD